MATYPSNLGCNFTAQVNILNDAPVTTIDVTANNIVSCQADGTLNDGSASTIVLEDGVDNTGAYGLTWTDNSGAAADENNLPQGNYFVSATNPANGCAAEAEFTIDDETFNDPDITLLSFQNPTRCEQPANVLGELHVNATGGGASYSYAWYNGNSASGPVIDADADLIDQTAGDYTLEVTNNTTRCRSDETYTLELEVADVDLTASASPVTNCDSPDGAVFATVTSGGSNNYTYSWVDVNGTAVGTGKDVPGLDVGDYTVTAIDQADAFCESSAVVTITNEQVSPNLSIEEVAPLTVCDLTRADGVARASVDGGFVGYTFEWFEGGSDAGPVVYAGTEYSGLEAATYTVRATNNISQCSSLQSITISSDVPDIPDPTIEVIAHDTHCIVDNGILSVSVNGNTSNYVFDWYIGTEVSGSPDFTGEIFTDLAMGPYTVTATSLVTGCISAPVTGEVQEILEYPALEFEIGNASCNEENGFALMRLTNNVEIENVFWTDLATGGQIAVGPNLTEVPEGLYHVRVVTAQGCEAEEEVAIRTEVTPFNGISRNGDNQNDFFKIDCITSFPDNVVKIFNRAGTLVYQTEGYDNNSKLFDGISNKGVSPMGTSLPDGTYFYVIDKNDGSKPLSGYLEIIN